MKTATIDTAREIASYCNRLRQNCAEEVGALVRRCHAVESDRDKLKAENVRKSLELARVRRRLRVAALDSERLTAVMQALAEQVGATMTPCLSGGKLWDHPRVFHLDGQWTVSTHMGAMGVSSREFRHVLDVWRMVLSQRPEVGHAGQ